MVAVGCLSRLFEAQSLEPGHPSIFKIAAADLAIRRSPLASPNQSKPVQTGPNQSKPVQTGPKKSGLAGSLVIDPCSLAVFGWPLKPPVRLAVFLQTSLLILSFGGTLN
jgi:hypothetical protein